MAHAAAELKPAPAGPTAADLAPLFKDLDAKAFATREAATAALDKYGETALDLVRRRTDARCVRGQALRARMPVLGPLMVKALR